MTAGIVSYCRIKNQEVTVNGLQMFEALKSIENAEFPVALYKKLEMNYPKFHKMDKLSKLGLLATELCIAALKDNDWDKSRSALIFANRASSLDTDRKHAAAIQDKKNYFPSPSVFVYTLANIVAGEIAIKHGITGENAFFISEKFEPSQLVNYTDLLFNSNVADTAICGWIDVDAGEQDLFVYCVKKSNFKKDNAAFQQDHTWENTASLYEK